MINEYIFSQSIGIALSLTTFNLSNAVQCNQNYNEKIQKIKQQMEIKYSEVANHNIKCIFFFWFFFQRVRHEWHYPNFELLKNGNFNELTLISVHESCRTPCECIFTFKQWTNEKRTERGYSIHPSVWLDVKRKETNKLLNNKKKWNKNETQQSLVLYIFFFFRLWAIKTQIYVANM